MKRFLLTILALALLVAPVSFAGTFAGINWEGNPGIVFGGQIIEISPKVATFGYGRISIDSASYENGLKTQHGVGAELTYHLVDNLNQDFYLIGGLNCDWANASLERSLTTYITQSVGGLFTTRATFLEKIPLLNSVFEDPGLWFAGKFRPQLFDNDSRWQDKFVIGVGIYSGI